MLALLGNIHVLIVDPAPAVADHIVIRSLDRRHNLRMPRQRHRHAEDRQRQPALAELAMDAPEPCPAAVLIE